MILTTKGRYAVMAMLDIAKFSDKGPVNLSSVSVRQNITLRYLEQIASKLKRAGILKSIKGPGGGYISESSQITIKTVINAAEESIKMTKCSGTTYCAHHNAICNSHNLWDGLSCTIQDYLGSITIEDCLKQNSQSEASVMIYFDHNATTNIREEAKREMLKYIDLPYNPSALHKYGRKAKYLLEHARQSFVSILRLTENYDVVFTSSGTEANNLIISNFQDKNILVSSIEHASILNTLDGCKNVSLINCSTEGIVDLNHLESLLSHSINASDTLVSIMYANNETGVIQPIKEAMKICKYYGARLHTDASQAIGKIDITFSDILPDFITMSSHKLGGPMGTGCLIHTKDFDLKPQIYGGGQEKNYRSGTENLHSIMGFVKSLEIAITNCANYASHVSSLRARLESTLAKSGSTIIGYSSNRIPNTSNITMPNVSSETQLIKFDLNNIAVSSGSSCSSGKIGQSHVLKAMGIEQGLISSSIRVSLNESNTEAEIDYFVKIWNQIADDAISTVDKNNIFKVRAA